MDECSGVARMLLAGSAVSTVSNLTTEEACFCIPIQQMGGTVEHTAAMACSWIAFTASVAILLYYGYHFWRYTCGWEEVYVVAVELIKVVLEIFFETSALASIVQINGVHTSWLRYAEWLLTCPVILIHLSNLTGVQHGYSKRTMTLLVSDIGTIVMGITSAFATGPAKIVFFLLGICYGGNTFYHASQIYVESYHEVPEGQCRALVKAMAWVFFSSWLCFPLLFVLGPEGFSHLTPYGSIIGHTFVDLLSKNLWGLLGHHLRMKIQEHISIHGDTLNKQTKLAGALHSLAEMEGHAFSAAYRVPAQPMDDAAMDPYAAAGGVLAVVQARPAAATSPRSPKASAATPRAGLQTFRGVGKFTELKTSCGGVPDVPVPVRVVLGVVDAAQVEYFKDQFSGLTLPVEVVPALGADAILQVAAHGQAAGPQADCILLHPEYLRDRGSSGLVAQLRALGQRVCAYGWSAQASSARDLIEAADLDGWVEGPAWGSGINSTQLATLLAQVQAQRISTAAGGGGGLSRSFSSLVQGSPLTSPLARGATNPLFGQDPATATATAAGHGNSMATLGSISRPATPLASAGGLADGNPAAALANGLFVTGMGSAAAGAVSPSLRRQHQHQQQRNPADSQTRGAAALDETELLQQLLAEIARLKRELGE